MSYNFYTIIIIIIRFCRIGILGQSFHVNLGRKIRKFATCSSWRKSASNIRGVSFLGIPVFHANYVGPYYEP